MATGIACRSDFRYIVTMTREKNRQGTLFQSFGFALEGIVAGIRRERNLRIHLVFAVVVPFVALMLKASPTELALLVLAIAAVIAAELFNAALEATVDLVTLETRPLAKAAKDTAAGAVLVLSIGAAVIGLIVLAPRAMALFSLLR